MVNRPTGNGPLTIPDQNRSCGLGIGLLEQQFAGGEALVCKSSGEESHALADKVFRAPGRSYGNRFTGPRPKHGSSRQCGWIRFRRRKQSGGGCAAQRVGSTTPSHRAAKSHCGKAFASQPREERRDKDASHQLVLGRRAPFSQRGAHATSRRCAVGGRGRTSATASCQERAATDRRVEWRALLHQEH